MLPITRHLAFNMRQNHTHARLFGDEEELGSYHFSKEPVTGILPFSFWIMNKKWPLSDDLAVHLLIFEQVSFRVLAVLAGVVMVVGGGAVVVVRFRVGR